MSAQVAGTQATGTHATFAKALINPAAALPPGLTTWNGSDPAQRFAIYRNNVAVSLISALKTSFPVVHELVGNDFFAHMARAYVAETPPRSVLMALYGQDFPDFIATFPPARSVPYLADVARLEAARIRSYHAPDAPCVTGADFAACGPEKLLDLRIALHPSLIILASPYAIVSIWAAHNGMGELAGIDSHAPETALIARPDMDVTVTRLAPGIATALQSLAGGATLGDAAEAAVTEPAFDLSGLFQILIVTGAATRLIDGVAQ